MNIPSIESLLAELDKVKAERDAALETINQQHRINVELFGETEQLKSALREAKEALTPYMKFVDGTQVKNHPAQVYDRINKVLGEE